MTALAITEGPLLWFLNRSSGVVVLVALTLALVLGILGADRNAGGRLPAFVPQALHRNLSVLALVLTFLHAATAVVDSYVDIRWWQALAPWGGTYEPLWLGLGALALDVMLLLALSTALRARMGHRAWHRIHLAGYAVWPLAFVHAAGIGTDASAPWSRWLAAGCAVCLVTAAGIRAGRRRPDRVVAGAVSR